MDDRIDTLTEQISGLEHDVENEQFWDRVGAVLDDVFAQQKALVIQRLRQELKQRTAECRSRLDGIGQQQLRIKEMLSLGQVLETENTIESKVQELRRLKLQLGRLQREYKPELKPGRAKITSRAGRAAEIPDSVRNYRLPRGPRQNKSLSVRQLYEAWFVGNASTPDKMPIRTLLQQYPQWSSTETTYFNRLQRVARLLELVAGEEGDVAGAVARVEAYMAKEKIPGINALSDQCSKQKGAPGMAQVVERVRETKGSELN
ncbi:hypothetical protein OGAPHI_000937 [Ogataea philodendri]|uniref:Transcription activator GCR1-like domain-containing protein n=1 Tax=Ogataea philodendri TaxID=1378263 RepID=A0A9P8PFQ3_9ASCO|nr:uncharacterized protein OGAPHI_000937 [Ogataea philodendri]KAH3670422.1 hypothetical protein OGAPHI_000937 [Ogataea philodendri]